MTVPHLQLTAQTAAEDTHSPRRARTNSFARLGGIEIGARVELGRAELLLREVARLRPGSVVRLDRKADDPVDLLVSGRSFARGEIVVIDGHLGLRITELAAGES